MVAASYLLVLLMGYGFVFFTSEGAALSMRSFQFPVLLFLFLVGFYTPELQAGAVFVLIWIMYAFCFIAAWRWRENFHAVVTNSFSRPFRSLFNNFLFAMPVLSSMLFTAAYFIISSQESVGIPTGQPSFSPGTSLQEIFLQLAYAPVTEELGFRLVPIGMFMTLYVFLLGRNVDGRRLKLLVTSVFYPDGAKRMAGLRNVGEHGIWRGISRGEWTIVLATSVVFGFAHVISGFGWELGKFTSVFVQGFFFAVTYLVYGFEAPILLHWFFNYYLFFFDPSVVLQFFPATAPLLLVIESVVIALPGFRPGFSLLGVFGWIMVAAFLARKLLKRASTKRVVPAESPVTLPS